MPVFSGLPDHLQRAERRGCRMECLPPARDPGRGRRARGRHGPALGLPLGHLSLFLSEPCPWWDLPSQPASPPVQPLPSSLSKDTAASATAQPFLVSPLRPGWVVGLIEVCSLQSRITFFIRASFEPWQTPPNPPFLRTNGYFI